MDDEKLKIKFIYGSVRMQPLEWLTKIEVQQPRNALEAIWWAAQDIIYDVIVPAVMVALSVTAFAWGFHFI